MCLGFVDLWIAWGIIGVCVVLLICFFVAFAWIQAMDHPDVPLWRAVTGTWQSTMRWMCGCVDIESTRVPMWGGFRMSDQFAYHSRDKIKRALELQMPPLTYSEQCWLYEMAFGEQIETRKRCEKCDDDGCEVCV